MRLRNLVPADPLARMLLPILLTIIAVLAGGGVSLILWGAPGWGTPSVLPRPVTGNQVLDSLAMGPAGVGFVTWVQRTDQGYRLYAAQFLPDLGWTVGAPVDSVASSGPKVGQIAVDDTGDALVAWKEGAVPSYVWANRYLAGLGWETPTMLWHDDANWTGNVFAAMDAAGNGLVVWSQYATDPSTGGTIGLMWGARSDAASGWGPAEPVGGGWVSGLALWPDGRALVTAGTTGGNRSIGLASSPSGVWSPPSALNTNATGTGDGSPELCSVGQGRALAVWNQLDSNGLALWSASFDVASGWTAAAPIPNLSHSGAVGDLACNDEGDALAVWVDSNWGSRNLAASWWNSAAGWSSPFLIGTPVAAGAAWPEAILDPRGDAVVAWWQEGTPTHAYAAQIARRSASAPSFQLDPGGDGVAPRVAVDALGDAVVVWEQDSGTTSRLWSNRYFVNAPGVSHVSVPWIAGFFAAAAGTSVLTVWWWRRELRVRGARSRMAPAPPGESS